ncbi:CueP family metal-binding protein [Gorillibacterium massiliense]|uniref:CueP family metal-binding protein n=1 Tax=Gorillibacterium massiliense TaxID=1280390 RepID=UPI0004B89CDE|nr:CueP family metal-binding protein [Gorillibacterium massiliense]
MKRKIVLTSVLGAVVVVLLSVYWGNNQRNAPSKMNNQDIKQLVQDFSSGKQKAKSASITSNQLIVTRSGSRSVTYELPTNEFFLSIAPYVEKTHPCATHNLVSCRGEMVNEEFKVFIEDIEGNVLIDRSMKSQENGFIDLWLPRDKKYNVTVEQNGKIAKSEISTFDNDDTCITTMHLVDNKNV